jgi:hypothetical protein
METKTYTVDMTIRVYVEATSDAEAQAKAVDLYAGWSPDGIGQYGNVLSREGMWYLCEHGDETDAQVWDPYNKESV